MIACSIICGVEATSRKGGVKAEMTRKPAVNVVKRPDGWAVTRDNADRASGVFETQQAAIERAREIARNAETELRIQGEDHRWRSVDSYGNDPAPPIDKEH